MQLEDQSWSVEEIIPLLRKVSFFEGLSDEDLGKVASIVKRAVVEEEEILFQEGDQVELVLPVTCFYVDPDWRGEETGAAQHGTRGEARQ